MAYWILNKTTNEAKIKGCLPAVVVYTKIDKEKLKYVFSYKKELEFENDKFRIVRTDLERYKRK